MILAAHHPCYLPDVRFFYKAFCADVLVLADDMQYSTGADINRTRIKTAAGVRWLTVPVLTKGLGAQRIGEVKINPAVNWQKKHWKTLTVNYRYAAYFDKYRDFLEGVYREDYRYLLDLNSRLLNFLIEELHVSTKIVCASQIKSAKRGVRRLLEYLQAFDCDIYLVEPKYAEYLQRQAPAMRLQTLECVHPVYYQQFGDFAPGLSAFDLLMNEGPGSREILLQQVHV